MKSEFRSESQNIERNEKSRITQYIIYLHELTLGATSIKNLIEFYLLNIFILFIINRDAQWGYR